MLIKRIYRSDKMFFSLASLKKKQLPKRSFLRPKYLPIKINWVFKIIILINSHPLYEKLYGKNFII